MILFPNSKINLGLNIVSKRADGYHNLETCFFPIFDLYDTLEVVESNKISLQIFGIEVNGKIENNLIIKALRLLKKDFQIPNIVCFLKKTIPTGAGLGGGSANAAFMLKLLNEKFSLNISDKKLENYASKLGADCAFFVRNKPSFAQGTGNILSDIALSLQAKYIVLAKPNIHVSTTEAYSKIIPHNWQIPLEKVLKLPVENWKNYLFNDFEKNIFAQHQQLAEIKQKMYDFGADYASMSGSGATIFGIFNKKPDIKFENMFVFETKL
jgi:4-diphosphocytidyl-2-C-methyl-D-erythritol kinase